MTAESFRTIEHHRIVTPLGVLFVDDFSGDPVGDDLEVWTWPEGVPQLRVPMRRAGAGSYAAHGLPGFREFAAGAGDEDFWREWLAPDRRRTFVVEARDLQRRFLPAQVRVELPAAGLARPSCWPQLPSNRRHGVPLFSASTRAVPASAATIRAQLYDRSAKRPASWAVVDARLDGRTIARGMADSQGHLAVLLPYPEPQSSWTSPPADSTSPASPPRLPLSQQRWTIGIEVRYERAFASRRVPDLCEALAQAPAQLLADAGSPSQELTQFTLQYGVPAVLRTANATAHERGHVLVTTGGSPL